MSVRSPAPLAEVCTHGNRFSDHQAKLRTHRNRFSDPRAKLRTHHNRFSDHRAMLRTHRNRISDPRAKLRTHHNRFSDPRAMLRTHRNRSPASRAEVFGRYISIPFTSWTVCGVSVGSRRGRRGHARDAGVKLKSRKPRTGLRDFFRLYIVEYRQGFLCILPSFLICKQVCMALT